MAYEESIEQLKSLIEHFNNGGNDFNATDIEAIKYLLKENENLRADYGNKSQVERDLLRIENQELKRELKDKPDTEITLEDNKGNVYTMIQTERVDMQSKLNKSIQQLLKDNQALKEQQKEFIKYLQEELNIQIQEESIGCEITNKKYILEGILNKYKDIIGDDK